MNSLLPLLTFLGLFVGYVAPESTTAPPIQIECPCPAHPATALVTAIVNAACPDKAGDAIATVTDYTEVPGNDKPSRTYRQLKSVSPCG